MSPQRQLARFNNFIQQELCSSQKLWLLCRYARLRCMMPEQCRWSTASAIGRTASRAAFSCTSKPRAYMSSQPAAPSPQIKPAKGHPPRASHALSTPKLKTTNETCPPHFPYKGTTSKKIDTTQHRPDTSWKRAMGTILLVAGTSTSIFARTSTVGIRSRISASANHTGTTPSAVPRCGPRCQAPRYIWKKA